MDPKSELFIIHPDLQCIFQFASWQLISNPANKFSDERNIIVPTPSFQIKAIDVK